jgi:hypothetical protein
MGPVSGETTSRKNKIRYTDEEKVWVVNWMGNNYEHNITSYSEIEDKLKDAFKRAFPARLIFPSGKALVNLYIRMKDNKKKGEMKKVKDLASLPYRYVVCFPEGIITGGSIQWKYAKNPEELEKIFQEAVVMHGGEMPKYVIYAPARFEVTLKEVEIT